MRNLVRSVFLVGLSSVANTGVSVLRNKLLAVTLGPGGIGVFAQLMGLQNLAVGVVPLGLQTAALRYFALYRTSDPELLARFVSASARLFLWLSLAATVLCLVLLRPLTIWATDDVGYLHLLVPPILGIAFLVQSQTWLTYVQAGLDMRAYSQALVVTSVLGLVVLAPLVLGWGLKGASVHLFVFAFLSWAVARWTAVRAMGPATRRAVDRAPFDRQVVGSLFRFGAANLPPFVLAMVFPFVLRAQIVHDGGLVQNGLYQALFAISAQYLAIPLNAMTAYSFPRISQLRDLPTINQEVNDATRVAVLISTLGILGILLSRDLVIRILYSRHFMAAVPLFPVQMIGDLLRAVCFAIQLPLIPQERFRARNVMSFAQYAIFAAILFGVPASHRVWGAVWGHTASWGAATLMMLLYLRRVNGFRFTPENRRLLISSFAAVIAVAALPFPDLRMRLIGVAIAVTWAGTSVTRHEVDRVFQAVRARLQEGGGGPDA
jgi:PST family polysaccharide transporter